MEILAGLIKLDSFNHLPLPWYNRPSLGLMSGTPVYVAGVTALDARNVPPDLIVTPLRISDLHNTFSISIDLPENAGTINKVLSVVGDRFNIALMETVTIDQRSKHRVTMVLEPSPIVRGSGDFSCEVENFLNKIGELGALNVVSPYYFANQDIKFERGQFSKVINGRVKIDNIRTWVEKSYGHLANEYDFNKVVVSSNADGRFIRYIFPKIGSFEATIPHDDIPTAMQQLSASLASLEYNILLSRISKSEAVDAEDHQKSVTVAICEPVSRPARKPDKIAYIAAVQDRLADSLQTADKLKYFFSVPSGAISLGRSAKSVEAPQRKSLLHRTIEAPPEIAVHLSRYEAKGKKVIFVSLPGSVNNPGKGKLLRQAAFETIRECGCIPYDGFEEPFQIEQINSNHIYARAWRADAGIFLAVGEDKPRWLNEGQLLEWAFMRPLTQKTVVVCHQETIPERSFMMTDESRITYSNLGHDGDYLQIQKRLKQQIMLWFPGGER